MGGKWAAGILVLAAVCGIIDTLFGNGLLTKVPNAPTGDPTSIPGPDSTRHSAAVEVRYDPPLRSTDHVPWPQHVESGGLPEALDQQLRLLPGMGRQIRSLALDAAGAWVILHDSGTISYQAPTGLLNYLRLLQRQGGEPVQIALAPDGNGWAVLDTTGHLEHRTGTLGAAHVQGAVFRGVALFRHGSALLRPGADAVVEGVASEPLSSLLRDDPLSPVRSLAVADQGFAAIRHDGTCPAHNVPDALQAQLQAFCRNLRVLALTPQGHGWAVVGDIATTPEPAIKSSTASAP